LVLLGLGLETSGLGLETSGLGLEAFGFGLETPGLVNIPESKHILTNVLPYSRQTVHSMYRQQLVSTPYHTTACSGLDLPRCRGQLRWPNAQALPEWEGRNDKGVHTGVGGALLLPLFAGSACVYCVQGRRRGD